MREFLLSLGNISFQVGIVVCIVLFARMFLTLIKAPKWASYFLWFIVFLRMVIPFPLESSFSLFPEQLLKISEYIGTQSQQNTKLESSSSVNDVTIDLPNGLLNDASDNIVDKAQDLPNGEEGLTVEMKYIDVVIFISWITGMLLIGLYSVISYWNLKKKLICSMHLRDNIFLADGIETPFVLGVLRPQIYLPSDMAEQDFDYVLQHEKTHIRRRDYLIKIVAYFITGIHWFNPFAWVAFLCMGKDMELACDEAVLRNFDTEYRTEYASVLLKLSAGKKVLSGAPLAFGEGNTESRIKNIMKYKKPVIAISGLAIIVLIVLAVGLLTNPKSTSPGDETEADTATASEAAVELFEAANPYIGDASANGKLIGIIFEHFRVLEASNNNTEVTTELQTSEEPYVLTLHFSDEPDNDRMWKSVVLLLALIENCGEVDWDYENIHGELVTYYVSVLDVNQLLGIDDIKEYGTSAEKVEELLKLLEYMEALYKLSEIETPESEIKLEHAEATEELSPLGKITDYMENPHDAPEVLEQEIDLNGDGIPEKITLTNLGYNGGDGGYELKVFREQDSKEVEIPLPESYVSESGFDFSAQWDGEQMNIYVGDQFIITLEPELLESIYQKKGFSETLLNAKGKPTSIPGDAVSGFTILYEEDNATPVLVTKTYMSGLDGHVDCIGYGITYMILQEDDTWKVIYDFVLDE